MTHIVLYIFFQNSKINALINIYIIFFNFLYIMYLNWLKLGQLFRYSRKCQICRKAYNWSHVWTLLLFIHNQSIIHLNLFWERIKPNAQTFELKSWIFILFSSYHNHYIHNSQYICNWNWYTCIYIKLLECLL